MQRENSRNASAASRHESQASSTNYTRRRRVTVENFLVIWLDMNINEIEDEYRNSIDRIRCLVNSIKLFNDADQCVDFLTEIKNEKLFMLVSGRIGQTILPSIEDIPHLDSIYVFCEKQSLHEQWARRHRKVKGVFTQIESICDALRRDIRQCDNDLLSISILSPSHAQNGHVNELDRSFIFAQLLNGILLEMDYDGKTKNEFIDFCRLQYCDNRHQEIAINEFEKDYDPLSSIWWYTRECFVYSMLNKALRTQDLEILIKMGFFIRDIHRQIERQYSIPDNQRPRTVYRGQCISKSYFEKIKMNEGGLLSFNNYLTASTDRQTSLNYALYARNNVELIGILFRIEIDPSISSTPFTSLKKISYYPDSDADVLFSMPTVFRIVEMKRIDDHLWELKLTLTSHYNEQLQHMIEHVKKKIDGRSGEDRLRKLMDTVNEFAKEANDA